MALFNVFNFENPTLRFDLGNILFWRRRKYDKGSVRILFVDNEEMPVADNLRKAGWSVSRVKDIKNLDDDLIRNSQIIFVDYKGVGKNISQQMEGVGLICALKEQYKDSKRIILYSAMPSLPNKLVLDGFVDKADNKIRKNADTAEFIKMILSEITKLK